MPFAVQTPDKPFDRESAAAAMKEGKKLFYDAREEHPGIATVHVACFWSKPPQKWAAVGMFELAKFTGEGRAVGCAVQLTVNQADQFLTEMEAVAPLEEWRIATPM